MALELLGVVGGSAGMSMISTGAAEAAIEKNVTITNAGGVDQTVVFDGDNDLSNPELPELEALLTEADGNLVVAHSGLYVVFVDLTAYTETAETVVACSLRRGATFDDPITISEVKTNASDGIGDNYSFSLRSVFRPPLGISQSEAMRRMSTTVALNADDVLQTRLSVSTGEPTWSIDVSVSITLTALMLQL